MASRRRLGSELYFGGQARRVCQKGFGKMHGLSRSSRACDHLFEMPYRRKMKFPLTIHIIMSFLMGCADLSENPTDAEHFEPVPEAVLTIIDGNCTICHQPSSTRVFKGQKPYYRSPIPDGSTILDTLQIWQARKRISIRVSEMTMPRASDTSNVFSPLSQDQIDLIVNWADRAD